MTNNDRNKVTPVTSVSGVEPLMGDYNRSPKPTLWENPYTIDNARETINHYIAINGANK